MRDELRGCGIETGGPAPFGQTETRIFAQKLDHFLTKLNRELLLRN
jgi:hypothetical protein